MDWGKNDEKLYLALAKESGYKTNVNKFFVLQNLKCLDFRGCDYFDLARVGICERFGQQTKQSESRCQKSTSSSIGSN